MEDRKVKIDQACEAGINFAKHFYETLDKRRHLLTNLFLEDATAVWNGNGFAGKDNIRKFYESLPVSMNDVRSVDAQPVLDGLGLGQTTIIVTVSGISKFDGRSSSMFSETFILTAQPGAQGDVWKIVSNCYRCHEPVV